MAELAWGAATDAGQIRAKNEDSVLAVDGVFVVADGMGGHEAGEVASQIAVDRLRADLHGEELPEAAAVIKSISNANGDIFRAAIANPGQSGMGTTVTAIAVIADPHAGRAEPNIDINDDPGEVTPITPAEPSEALLLANVGDSRTYLMRHGRLRRVTVDHNYVQELVSTGHITEEEARTHPRRNIITRALGIEPDVKIDWWTLPLIRDDRFLLCSDGLVDEVLDEDIVAVLRENADPQDAADRLVEIANEAGGRDNITVIVLDVKEGDAPPDPTQELDVVPLWSDEVDPTPAGSLEIDADRESLAALATAPAIAAADDDQPTDASPDATSAKKRDRGPKRFLIAIALAAVVVAIFAVFAAWARGGYYVQFDGTDDDSEVIIYRGRTDGVLWFDPTAETAGGPARSEITDQAAALVEARPRFDSFGDAAEFVSQLEPTSPPATVPVTTTSPTTTERIVAPPRPSTTTTDETDATDASADNRTGSGSGVSASATASTTAATDGTTPSPSDSGS